MMLTAPISKLDDDTLLTIFSTITERTAGTGPQANRPLTIVRAASQVCQWWRALLLASPWIWGRVVDLDVTNDHGPRRIKWMDEVVRRAGSAPLWISGSVGEQRAGSRLFNKQSYFIHLLEAWEQIEQLSVVIFGLNIHGDIQRHFLSRAPILKLFDVTLRQSRESLFLDTLQPGSSQSLFADHAPLLREIRADKVAFKLNSPWLSNIREICPVPTKFTLKEIFILLQQTPLLERISLNMKRQIWNGTVPPFPKPRLPNLSSISIFSNLALAARILDYISPANLSAFHMKVWDTSSVQYEHSILPSFKQNMPYYISSYFTSKPPSPFLLVITRTELRFCDTIQNHNWGQSFNIEIRTGFGDQQDTNDVFACLLDGFTLSPTHSRNPSLFMSITELTLILYQVQPGIFPHVYFMLAVFHHVQVIETNEDSGHAFSAISESSGQDESQAGGEGSSWQPILFPELHTVRVIALDPDDRNINTGLTSFLMKRKMIGFPVATLDFRSCRKSLYTKDLRALEAVVGLEVIWKEPGHNFGEDNQISSYICGTGEPDKLKRLFF